MINMVSFLEKGEAPFVLDNGQSENATAYWDTWLDSRSKFWK